MTCLLIKARSIKPRPKGLDLKLNTYVPLTVMEQALREVVSTVKKNVTVSLVIVDSSDKKQKIEFPNLELGQDFSSLLYVLNEDILQSEKEVEFDEVEQLRALSSSLATQFLKETEQLLPYQQSADKLNATGFKKLARRLPSFKKSTSESKEIEEESQNMESTVHSDNEHVEESDSQTTPEPLDDSPVDVQWEDEIDDELVDAQEAVPSRTSDETPFRQNMPLQEPVKGAGGSSVNSVFTFESFLQTKDDNPYVNEVTQTLTRLVTNPVEVIADSLGINTTHPTPLEEKQIAYLNKQIDRAFFQRLQGQFFENLTQLSSALSQTLEKLYLDSGMSEHDLNEFVSQKVSDKKQELTDQYDTQLVKLNRSLNVEKEQKLTSLQAKHDLELQELQAKQLEEKQQTVADFDLYGKEQIDRLKADLHHQEQQELTDYQATVYSERYHDLSVYLLSEKDKLLTKRDEAILKEVETVRQEQNSQIEQLMTELVEKETDFQVLLEQERLVREKELEHSLKEKELQIKQEEVTLLAKEKAQKEKQQLEQADMLMRLMQAQLLKATQTEETKQIEVTLPKEPTPPAPAKESPIVRRMLYTVGILSLCSFSFLGVKLYQSEQNSQKIQSDMVKLQESSNKLTQSLKGLSAENMSLKNQVIENKETLPNLLAEGNYTRAIELNGDQLDTIENAMYEAKDLKQLSAFNEAHKSQYGRLDEAILSGNDKKMIEEYKKLNTKARLPGDRELHLPNDMTID